MASFIYFASVCFLLSGLISLGTRSQHDDDLLTHTVQRSSLIPSPDCHPSTKATERESTLSLVHNYGPCFQPDALDKIEPPSLTEILLQDQSRINLINTMLAKNCSRHEAAMELGDSHQIPVIDGGSFKLKGFLVKVGFGTPKQEVHLMIDTGSDLTWTQCLPCDKCHEQKDPVYNRTKSATYVSIEQTDPLCALAPRSDMLRHEGTLCKYNIEYLDDDSSGGYFAKELLTLDSELVPGFKFGCGTNQNGRAFKLEAGILGLDRSQVSIISQTASKYKQVFSYCLPSSPSHTGQFTFGSHNLPKETIYTKLITTHGDLYGLSLIGINMGGKRLPIDKKYFKVGTTIDSGSAFTYLPKVAYNELAKAFTALMTKNYPKVNGSGVLKDCYDVSKDPQFTVPAISFVFEDAEVVFPPKGPIAMASESKVCLAFVANEQEDYTDIGNIAQKTMEVVYDIPGKRIGFYHGGCE